MTTIELTQHPELAALAAELRKGEVVIFTDHGAPLGEVQPARRGREVWKSRLEALHQSFTSPAYPGNSVVDMRRESR
jgi:antitoxin (DNA-binding transcriptional repressor) of toxin-antitoxin stability system